MDDYDGVDDSPPVDVLGNPLTEYAAYRVQVSVAYADAAQVAAYGLDDATDAKVVTVTVTPPGGTPIRYPLVRSNY